MAYSHERLTDVFDRTDGLCHICHDRLVFSNYGMHGSRGAWEVEHSRPWAGGGSERLSNLYAAHTSCNRSKKAGSTRSARSKHGKARAPHSVKKRANLRVRNGALGAGGLGVLGAVLAGPIGAAVGAGLGFLLGHESDPGH